jgi:voltage-gated sodium channel
MNGIENARFSFAKSWSGVMSVTEQQMQPLSSSPLPSRTVAVGSVAAGCRHVAGHWLFHNVILGVIALNAVIVGLETSHSLMAAYEDLFLWLNTATLCVFLVEIGIRLVAEWPHLLRFFRDGWNIFDFIIVVVSLLPETGTFATVARLARVLRVTRLISALPELRLIVSTMLRSIPSMGHVILLLSLLLYVYGVFGYYLFHRSDPTHWGTLGTAILTLFQMLTLEGWVEIQRASLAAHSWAWLYYASFIIVAVFVVINLFIAVVINNLEAAKADQRAAAEVPRAHDALLRQITELREQLNGFERMVERAAAQPEENTHRRTGSL